MRALVVNHSAEQHLFLGTLPDPEPAPHQALISVRAVSLNPGDLHQLAGAANGVVPGWEAAGVVVRAAADGTGPREGTPVVTLGINGAWAQLRAVDTDFIGTVPQGLDLGAASTLPIAATSALRALRVLGSILGRRVLVTGASGAVGRFAVQLAHLGGAHVVATARDPRATQELRALGADDVVIGTPSAVSAPVHGVIETVGGAHLAEAFDRLSAGGTLVSVGRASGQASVLSQNDMLGDGGRHGRSITTFFLADGTPGLDVDMTWLADRLADGAVNARIATRIPWTELTTSGRLSESAALTGKVVLDVAA